MRVLTLHQPHASLCVIVNPETGMPYKTIETRGWKPPASLIGQRIALHAAQKVVYGLIGDWRCETWFSDVDHDPQHCYCDEGEVGPPCTRGATRTPCLTRVGADPIMLPLGAIVATCTLVDVVPMVAKPESMDESFAVDHEGRLSLFHGLNPHKDWPAAYGGGIGAYAWHIEAQRPYGDFTPGRFAWLLTDIVPVDPPVPFKGGQRLSRTWEPVAA